MLPRIGGLENDQSASPIHGRGVLPLVAVCRCCFFLGQVLKAKEAKKNTAAAASAPKKEKFVGNAAEAAVRALCTVLQQPSLSGE